MQEKEIISWNDFEKVDIRVGTIVKIADFPEAHNPSYKLEIDFGKTIGIKKSAAQITQLYTKEVLLGKQIIAIVNFPKKQIANFMSECLILGAVKGKNVVLLKLNKRIKNGEKVK